MKLDLSKYMTDEEQEKIRTIARENPDFQKVADQMFDILSFGSFAGHSFDKIMKDMQAVCSDNVVMLRVWQMVDEQQKGFDSLRERFAKEEEDREPSAWERA